MPVPQFPRLRAAGRTERANGQNAQSRPGTEEPRAAPHPPGWGHQPGLQGGGAAPGGRAEADLGDDPAPARPPARPRPDPGAQVSAARTSMPQTRHASGPRL